MTDETASWDATETAARIRAGELSAEEAARAAIARAEAWQPRIHAVAHPDYEAGLRRAREPRDGCFAGVPTFIKDMEDFGTLPTRFGSAALPSGPARATAPSIAQFLGTGPVVLGKSTTAEFGLTCTVEPPDREPTRNPHALDRSTGGSSGGAAALVAAGVVPIAHGGDGGGSIRIPAAFCGLVGLKASRGRLVDMAAVERMPVKIATYGVLTRTVRDTAAFFADVERRGAGGGLPPIGHVEGPGDTKLRVGLYFEGPLPTQVDPEVRAAVEGAARRLEALGHAVEPVAAPIPERLVQDFLVHWAVMAAGVERLVKQSPGGDVSRLEPWTRALARNARRRFWRIPGAIYRLRRFESTYEALFERIDVLLCPTTARPAPPLGYLSTDLPYEEKLERLLGLVPYTPVQNASGGPAVSVPAGRSSDGLPIGVQLAGPRGSERRLLELAYALEAEA